jgi:hypothetical protein
MARYPKGIMGPIRGKVGSVIGSSWKGVPYLKGPYKPRTKKISKKEKHNRIKFAKAQFWLKPLLDFVRIGFKGYKPPLVEGYIAAKSYLLKNAFEGTGADAHINPELVKVSFGDLPLSENIAVTLTNGSLLEFTWDTTFIPEEAREEDQVMLLAYDIQRSLAKFTTTGEFRKAGKDSLQLQKTKGKKWLVYLAFTAHDRSRQSHSIYLGEFRVS